MVLCGRRFHVIARRALARRGNLFQNGYYLQEIASALSVDHFVKTSSVIHYSSTAFKREASDIIRLAETEGLDGHARSIKVRLKK